MNSEFSEFFERLRSEMDKVVIGYSSVKNLSLYALLAEQHVLLEGLPGTAKSLFVEVFQKAISDSASVRVQMTADVKPMDLLGVRIYNPNRGGFEIEQGPLCGKNFVLADEINRAPGKTLSSFLSAMQERRIFISGQAIELPDPYFVMATQNPVEQEGVYPLPEAALDRFAMKLIVPYATREEEELILATEALDGRTPQDAVNPVTDIAAIVKLRESIKRDVYVSRAAVQYIVKLVRASRPGSAEHAAVNGAAPNRPGKEREVGFDKQIDTGASVRAQLALRALSRVSAAHAGRSYVLPEDIRNLVAPVLRHRINLSFEAISEGITPESIIARIIERTEFHPEESAYLGSALERK